MTVFDVTLADIEAARRRIAGRIRATPAYPSPALSAAIGRPTAVKLETLQIGGSFKVRGGFNKMLQMSDQERAKGVVTVSGGNHAIATAQVAGLLGVSALVLMPKTTPAFNVRLTQAGGADVELCEDAAEAFAKAEAYAAQGRVFVHPYDDPAIIAGHGTLGLELLEAVEDLSHVFLSIGGGGFAAGVAAALKARKPGIAVIGVETTGAQTMTKALEAGEPVTIRATSIARTLGAPFVTPRTLAAARAFLDRIVLVEDADVVRDIDVVLQEEKTLCEPAAACVLTAARQIAPDLPAEARIGLVLCGSNVALEDLAGWRDSFAIR